MNFNIIGSDTVVPVITELNVLSVLKNSAKIAI